MQPRDAVCKRAADAGLIENHHHSWPGSLLAKANENLQILLTGAGKYLSVQQWPEWELHIDIFEISLRGSGLPLLPYMSGAQPSENLQIDIAVHVTV